MSTASTSTKNEKLTVDVWADVVCPWCYVGEHRLEEAIAQSPHREDIELRVHTFQLHPGETGAPMPTVEYLAQSHGIPVAQARSMEGQLAAKAQSEGMVYEVDRPAANTLDMLRVVQLGKAHGLGWETLRGIQKYLFAGNNDAFDHAAIEKVAVSVGLPADEVRRVLASNEYADDVRADHNQATQLGARGVPFTVLGERLGVPGAVETSGYSQAIEQAWEQVNG